MMSRFDMQILRAATAELGPELQAGITDPAVLAKLGMTRLLLAHALAQQTLTQPPQSIAEEVAALQQSERDEQALLATPAAAGGSTTSITAETLTDYLRERLHQPALRVVEVQASLGGFSKQTWMLRLEAAPMYDNALVLRRDQEGGPVETYAADEFDVIRHVYRCGVPVPEPVLVDRAPPFGGSLLLMRRAPGRPAFDVTGQHLCEQGLKAARALARVLARIHAVALKELDLPAEIATLSLQEHVRRQLRLYEQQWQRRRIMVSPTLRAAFDWLHAHVPQDRHAASLVHGDASLRNLLVHDGRESAMLDWELWHLGDAGEDIAYCRPDVEQAMPWDEFLHEYQAHGGRAFDAANTEYYTILGAVRNAVFAQSCLHDLLTAQRPEAKFAFGALVLGRRLIYSLAEKFGKS